MKYYVLLDPMKPEWLVTDLHKGGGHCGVWSGAWVLQDVPPFESREEAESALATVSVLEAARIDKSRVHVLSEEEAIRLSVERVLGFL